MGLIYITRRERFNAAHKLWNPKWDAEKNHSTFGKCAHENWHGHNYELWVTVKGEVDPETGYLIDLKDLKQLINDQIIEVCDHKNINLDVPFMKDKMASTENICIGIWNEIHQGIEQLGATLHCVKLVETENNYAEYYG